MMSNKKRLEGKVAIVTGAASGIGACTALQFVREGAKVVLADRNEPLLLATCQEIVGKTGGEVVSVVADVSKDEDNRKIVETAVSTFGGLHVSFINAGVVTSGSLVDATDERINEQFGPNFKGVVFGLKHQLPAMSKTGDKGSIVITSSAAATKVLSQAPAYSMYACSKAATEMMVKYGAVEGAAMNVRVNGIAPGAVDTPMLAANCGPILNSNGGSPAEQAAKASHLTGKVISAEDIAPLVVFLASDDAAVLTGSIHRCDAGYVLK